MIFLFLKRHNIIKGNQGHQATKQRNNNQIALKIEHKRAWKQKEDSTPNISVIYKLPISILYTLLQTHTQKSKSNSSSNNPTPHPPLISNSSMLSLKSQLYSVFINHNHSWPVPLFCFVTL